MPEQRDNAKQDETINDRVKKVRQALGLSQTKFCQSIPLTRGYYAGIELGNGRVNARIIKLLTTSSGVSERFLETGEGDMFDTSVDPKLEELILIFKSLPLKFQNFVLREIKELKKLHQEE